MANDKLDKIIEELNNTELESDRLDDLWNGDLIDYWNNPTVLESWLPLFFAQKNINKVYPFSSAMGAKEFINITWKEAPNDYKHFIHVAKNESSSEEVLSVLMKKGLDVAGTVDDDALRDDILNIHDAILKNPNSMISLDSLSEGWPNIVKHLKEGNYPEITSENYIQVMVGVVCIVWKTKSQVKTIAKNANCPDYILKTIFEIFLDDDKDIFNAVFEHENAPKYSIEEIEKLQFSDNLDDIYIGQLIVDKQGSLFENEREITLEISGDGHEFVQGLIDNDFSKSIDELAANEGLTFEEIFQNGTFPSANSDSPYNQLNFKDYYDYNELGHCYAPTLDNLKLSLMVEGKSFELNTDIIGELDLLNGVSSDYGRLIDETEKDQKVVTAVTDERGFHQSISFKIKGPWDWNKLKLDLVSTDELGLCTDYGDFIKGLSYEDDWFDIDSRSNSKSIEFYFNDAKDAYYLN